MVSQILMSQHSWLSSLHPGTGQQPSTHAGASARVELGCQGIEASSSAAGSSQERKGPHHR